MQINNDFKRLKKLYTYTVRKKWLFDVHEDENQKQK